MPRIKTWRRYGGDQLCKECRSSFRFEVITNETSLHCMCEKCKERLAIIKQWRKDDEDNKSC